MLWKDDWARGERGLVLALKMAELIAKKNCRKRPWERGYIAILGESPILYFDSASQIWIFFVNSCPVKMPYML